MIERILQFTDMHLLGAEGAKFLGMDVNCSFQEVVKFAEEETALVSPQLILLTGDLSQDYSSVSYEIIAKAYQKFSCPVLAIPGNHDDFSLFNQILGKFKIDITTRDITVGGARILLLNSQWPGQIAGYLDDQELKFLERALSTQTDKLTLIFLHHPVLPSDSLWLDGSGLSNSQGFLNIVERYSQVKVVVSGHVHQEMTRVFKGITFLTTPATSWQFVPKLSKFKLDKTMPGYRWFDVSSKNWQTGVKRIAFNKKFLPKLNSKGY